MKHSKQNGNLICIYGALILANTSDSIIAIITHVVIAAYFSIKLISGK